MYGEEQSCAQIVPNEAYLKQAAAKQFGGSLAQNTLQETELSSILTTLEQQAYEVRGITASILQRVSPQCENESAEKQIFGSGYVGRAESIRSTLSECIRLLGTLSKLA